MNFKTQLADTLHIVLESIKALEAGPYTKLDKDYEEELMKELTVIPEYALESIAHGIDVFKCIYGSLNFRELLERLRTLPYDLTLRFNVYEKLKKQVSEITDKRIKSFLVALLRKCKPILDCLTVIIENPLDYLHKLALPHELDDIL